MVDGRPIKGMDPEAKERLEHNHDLRSFHAAPFQVFVLVCDRDQALSYRAARRFQNILAGRRRGMSRLFCEMLDFCRENYQALWRDYAGSKSGIDLQDFVDLLVCLRSEFSPAEFADLERDLARLSRALFRAGFGFFPRQAQQEAYADVVHALRRCDLLPHMRELRARQGGQARATQ